MTVRGRLELANADGIPAIQLRDLAPVDGSSLQAVGRYQLDDVGNRYWASSGDVLFRSRGDRNTATVFDEFSAEPAVAIQPLVILRPRPGLANPWYVAWFINRVRSQRYFDKCAQGTNIRMISMECLANLELELPDLATQRRIVEVDRLSRREQELTVQLAAARLKKIDLELIDRISAEPSHKQTTHINEGS